MKAILQKSTNWWTVCKITKKAFTFYGNVLLLYIISSRSKHLANYIYLQDPSNPIPQMHTTLKRKKESLFPKKPPL